MSGPLDPAPDARPGGDGPPFESYRLAFRPDAATTADRGERGEPLLVGEDAFSRRWRARGPGGKDGEFVLVEVQRDVVDPSRLPESWGAVGNKLIDAVWRRRLAAHGVKGARWPSVLHCREKGFTFSPPAPSTGDPAGLEECDDDEKLAKFGLPSWTGTTTRLLFEAPDKFYALSPRPRGGGAAVGDWSRYADDLGAAVALARKPSRTPSAFPCADCSESRRCFRRAGGGLEPLPHPPLAQTRLVPLAFLPSAVAVRREPLLDFDEHADVLGGAGYDDLRALHDARWSASAGLRSARAGVAPRLPKHAQVAPVVALRRKLKLFEAAVAATLESVRRRGAPHLAITPAALSSHRIDADGGAFDLALADPTDFVFVEETAPGVADDRMVLPPPGLSAPYAHEDLARASAPAPEADAAPRAEGLRHARSSGVRVFVRSVEIDATRRDVDFDADVLVRLEGGDEIDPTDRVRLQFDGEEWAGRPLWCRPDRERKVENGFAVRAKASDLGPERTEDLRTGVKGRTFYGRATVYRTYGPFYDVHALGMLLARALLVNSAQRFEHVTDEIAALTRAAGAPDDGSGAGAAERIADLLASGPRGAALSDANLCIVPRETERGRGRTPARLWTDVLGLVAACLAPGREESICASTRLERGEPIERPYEELLRRVGSLLYRLPKEDGADARPAGATTDAAALERILELEKALAAETARANRLETELDETRRETAELRLRGRVTNSAAGGRDDWDVLREVLTGSRTPAKDGLDRAVVMARRALLDSLAAVSAFEDSVRVQVDSARPLDEPDLALRVRLGLRSAARGEAGAEESLRTTLRRIAASRARMLDLLAAQTEEPMRACIEGCRAVLESFRAEAGAKAARGDSEAARLAALTAKLETRLDSIVERTVRGPLQARLRKRLLGDERAERTS